MANEEVAKKSVKAITEAGDEANDAKKQKHRSPAYTSIGLKEAIEKARVIWEHEKRNEVAIDVAAGHWKAPPKSSTTLMAFSALKKFGLITDRGSGDQRYVKLTDLAFNILRAEPNSPHWITLIQKAALSPAIIAELWESDKENPKSTPSLKKYLEFEKHFNPAVIDGFIQSYRDTISFAKLGIGDKIVTSELDDQPAEIENDNREEVSLSTLGGYVTKKIGQASKKMLAQYSIPIGANEATITFTGAELTAGDFDALADYVVIFKKQFERKQKSESAQVTLLERPFVVKITNEGFEMMVKIVAEKFVNGEKIYLDDKGNDHLASKVHQTSKSEQA